MERERNSLKLPSIAGARDGLGALVSVSRTPVRAAILFAAGLRLGYLLLAASVAPHLYIDPELFRSNSLTETATAQSSSLHYRLLGSWERFDTLWYLRIARIGYDRPDAVVFYPLYPILIRFLAPILGGPMVAALVVATAATFFLFWGFLRLALLDFDHDVALRALIFLCAWPGSFIFFAGYPDSLVLALIIWSTYWSRTERWWLSTMAAFLAGPAKAVGVLVVAPLTCIAWKTKNWRAWVPVVTSVSGAAVFPMYLRLTNRMSTTQAYAEFWNTSILPPWRTLTAVMAQLFSEPRFLLIFNVVLLVVIAILAAIRIRPTAYLAYSVAAICVLLAKRTDPLLQSTARYVLVVFPAFLNMARSKAETLPLVLIGIALNVTLMLAFLKWSLAL
jgi:hypothetical protein